MNENWLDEAIGETLHEHKTNGFNKAASVKQDETPVSSLPSIIKNASVSSPEADLAFEEFKVLAFNGFPNIESRLKTLFPAVKIANLKKRYWEEVYSGRMTHGMKNISGEAISSIVDGLLEKTALQKVKWPPVSFKKSCNSCLGRGLVGSQSEFISFFGPVSTKVKVKPC